MANVFKMPEEMFGQILSRLPPKSLMRLKCVHKSWNALFSNPCFVAMHLRVYNEGSSSTCILFKRAVINRNETNNEEVVCSLLYLPNDNDNPDFVVEDLNLPQSMGLKCRGQFIEIPESEPYNCLHIVGHCNGIFCLSLYSGNFVFYNPAINEVKILPKSCLKESFQRAFGFGYDPRSNDYILVVIAYDGEKLYGDRVVTDPLQGAIYNLGIDTWSEIKTDFLETETTIFWPNFFQAYFKGNCFWVAQEKNKEFITFVERMEEHYIREVVVLFDIHHQVFHNILLPECLYEYPVQDMLLTVWNDSIALYGFHRGGSRPFEIWVMDDFSGVRTSWTKYLSIVLVEFPMPLAFWKNDDLVWVAPDFTRVASYNFITENTKYLPIHGVGRFEAFVCVKSIISVNI